MELREHNDGICIRCDELPVADGRDCCPECHWALVAEVESGFARLRAYLSGWAAFRDWELGRS
jgi:hypothetical protein